MEALNRTITVTVPNYLSNLPLPKSAVGFSKLSARDWISLIPLVGTLSFVGWLAYSKFFKVDFNRPINPTVQKDCPKVVHGFDIEDLGDKISFCRCWRSEQFPYCDGTHNDHNKRTGDNIGPLCVKRRNNQR